MSPRTSTGLFVVVVVALLGLGLGNLRQQQQIDVLEMQIAELRARPPARPRRDPSAGRGSAERNSRDAPSRDAVGADNGARGFPIGSNVEPAAADVQLLTGETVSSDQIPLDVLAAGLSHGGSEAVMQRLRATVREEMKEAESEERQERDERRRLRIEERVRTLAEELELSPEKTEGLVTAVTMERGQIRDIFRSARRGDLAFPEAQTQVGALRDATDESARGLLDDDEYEAFLKYREDTRGRFGRAARPATPNPPAAPTE